MKKKTIFSASMCSIVAGLIVCMMAGAGCVSGPANLTAAEVAGNYVHHQETIRDLSETVVIGRENYTDTDQFRFQKKFPYQYSMEYLNSGSEPNGTLIQTNGSVIWWYNPLSKTVRTTTHFDPNTTCLTDHDFQADITGLFVNYPGSYNLSGIDRVSNSYLVVFSAQPGESFAGLPDNYESVRVWIDAGSWTVKKIVFSDIEWPSSMTVNYGDIQINSGIPDSAFVFDPLNVPNPPPEFRHHDPVVFLMSFDDAYRVAGSGLVVPGWVPEGYAYSGGYQMGDGTISLSLVNGKNEIRYIDSPVVGRPYSEPVEGETIVVAINRTAGVFVKGHDKNQLVMIRDGHVYSLTGMADESEMVRMAKSLVHVDDRLIQTLPQKEPGVAKPLEVSELTSIIMPETWIRSHNNSTTTGVINIRITAREFNETFGNSKEYPDFLVYRNTSFHERVALYQLPKTMFALNNRDPDLVVLNHPESRFRFFPDLNAVFADRCNYDKIPCPAGGGGSHG